MHPRPLKGDTTPGGTNGCGIYLRHSYALSTPLALTHTSPRIWGWGGLRRVCHGLLYRERRFMSVNTSTRLTSGIEFCQSEIWRGGILNKRPAFIVASVVLLCLQLVQAPHSSAQVSPACKAKSPVFKEVSERTLLMMKKDIYKYKNQRFTLRALVQDFLEEQGIVFFNGYWVGKGSGGVSFGTKGLLAYATAYPGMFDPIVEGDLILAKIVVLPRSSPPTTKPIFLVCSISRITGWTTRTLHKQITFVQNLQ